MSLSMFMERQNESRSYSVEVNTFYAFFATLGLWGSGVGQKWVVSRDGVGVVRRKGSFVKGAVA